jgi:hypothetical protein
MCSQSCTFSVREKACIIFRYLPLMLIVQNALLKQHWVFVLLGFHVISSVSSAWPFAFLVITGTKTLYTNVKHVKLLNWIPKMEICLTKNPEILITFPLSLFTMAKQFKYWRIIDGAAKYKSTHTILVGNPQRNWPLRKRGVGRKNYMKLILSILWKCGLNFFWEKRPVWTWYWTPVLLKMWIFRLS